MIFDFIDIYIRKKSQQANVLFKEPSLKRYGLLGGWIKNDEI
jgi:hypothetical protein